MIKHVGIIVDDFDKYIKIFEDLGGIVTYRGITTEYDAECVFIDFGNAEVELIKGLKKKSHLNRFLTRYGVGLHHIAFSGKGEKKGAKPNMKVSFNLKNRLLIETVKEK